MDGDDDLYDGDCGYDDGDEAMEEDNAAGDGFYDDDDDCGREEDPVRRERPLEFSVSNGEPRSEHESRSRSIDFCMDRSSLDPPPRKKNLDFPIESDDVLQGRSSFSTKNPSYLS